MKKPVVISLLSLTVAATVLIGWHFQATPQPHPAVTRPIEQPEPAPAQPASTPVAAFKPYRWVVGDHAAWTLQTSLRLAGAEDPQAGQVTSVSGTLEMEVLAATPTEVRLLAMLHHPECQSGGVAMPTLAALCERTACQIILDPQGRLRNLAFSGAVAEEDRRFLKLVFGWPGSMVAESHSQYVEQKEEGEGLSATYTRRGDTIVKSRFNAAVNPGPTYQAILSSRFTGRLGHLWLSELEGSEDAEMVMNQQPFIRGTVWIKLHETEPAAPSVAMAQWQGQLGGLTLQPDAGAHSVGADLRREALAERWGTVPLTEMAAAFKLGAGMEENLGALKHLREWVVVHGSDGVNELLAAIANQDMDAELAGLMTHALATSEGDIAREGHVVILQNPASFPESVVNQALVSAGQQEEPSPALVASVSTLLKTQDDPQCVALLAAAALARQDQTMAKTLVSHVLPDLAEGTPAERVERSLIALRQAEVRDPAVVAAAERWESSTDPEVRVAVVRYLYRVSDNPTQIADEYRGDPDARIRGLFEDSATE